MIVLKRLGMKCVAMLACAVAAHSQNKPASPQDPQFREPYVDIDQWRDAPVRHRYVHGGFKGTTALFSLYFPPKEQYQGRFFQHITPTPGSENEGTKGSGPDNKVGFSIASGAYFVESNEGGMASIATDPTLAAYRVNAAVALYSRTLASQMYGPHRTYGYAFGGSGGAFRTIGGFENKNGVWDGVVPYVVGSPVAIPNVFTARLLALRVLKDKFPGIVDALEPGGSGDPFAGLNPEERGVFTEVTRLGFPVQSWSNYKTVGMGAFPILFEMVIGKDQKYFTEDFWNVPGYAGANPSPSLAKARIQHRTTIKKVIPKENPPSASGAAATNGVDTAWQQLQAPPAGFEIENAPQGNAEMATVIVKTGAAAGATFPLGRMEGNTIFVGISLATLMGGGRALDPLKLIKPGDEVLIDNSNFLASQYFHRYQVPTPDFYVWDQFRGSDGKPIYPQRPRTIGPEIAASAGGTTQSGRFQGKMIVLESLWDQDAFPWQADWYASKVKAAAGSTFNDNFRLWFTDHALHGDVELQADPTHTVSYLGGLQQALRDLSAWVEKGVAPPASTSYKVVDGQVQAPASARQRNGIQPVITVLADGKARADVKVGQPVTLSAEIEVPAHTGQVVAAEWSLEGNTEFSAVEIGKPAERVSLSTKHTFSKPGIYFPVLRAASQRQGDTTTPYARVQNLARARVVVR